MLNNCCNNIQLNSCFSLLAIIAFDETLAATQNVQIVRVLKTESNCVG